MYTSALFVFSCVIISVYGGVMMDPLPLPSDGDQSGVQPIPKPIPLGLTQEELNEECNKKCTAEPCLNDPPGKPDCRYYLQCKKGGGAYQGEIMICAHGTYWDNEIKGCDSSNLVPCKTSVCKNGEKKVKHDDDFCKTYWECEEIAGEPVNTPKCCEPGQKFDQASQQCVQLADNDDCQKACPLSGRECADPDVVTSPAAESQNCREYYQCQINKDYPVCCPEKFRYNKEKGECTADDTCTDKCDVGQFVNKCPLGKASYSSDLDGRSCQAYMTCNGTSLSEARCCAHGYKYNNQTNICENGDALDCRCPEGFKQDCQYVAAEDDPTKFYMSSEASNPTYTPCPSGTSWQQDACTCGIVALNAPDLACQKEMILKFDGIDTLSTGLQKNIDINYLGSILEGSEYEGKTTLKFMGESAIYIPFFNSAFPKLYAMIIFKHDGDREKMVLISNCQMGRNVGPSMEMAIENDKVSLELFITEPTNGTSERFQLQVASGPSGAWQKCTATVSDGMAKLWCNDGQPAENPVEGEVANAANGLSIGACGETNDFVNGFKGEIAAVEFSKCLKDEWVTTPAVEVP